MPDTSNYLTNGSNGHQDLVDSAVSLIQRQKSHSKQPYVVPKSLFEENRHDKANDERPDGGIQSIPHETATMKKSVSMLQKPTPLKSRLRQPTNVNDRDFLRQMSHSKLNTSTKDESAPLILQIEEE